MKGLRLHILISGIAAGLLVPGQMSFAADSAKGASAKEPAPFNELAPSHKRGVSFKEMIDNAPTNSVVAPTVIQQPKVNLGQAKTVKAVARAKTKTVKHAPQVAKVKKTGAAVTAKLTKPAQPVNSHSNNSGSDVQLVSDSQTEAVITASLNKAGNNPHFKVGETLVVNVTANTDCNLVIFNYDSQGTLTQIFPNEFQQSSFVRNGETVQIGGPESQFDYTIEGKGGAEKIFVYAYPSGEEKPLTVAMAKLPGSPFRSTEMTVEQYKELVRGAKGFFGRDRGIKVGAKKRVTTVSHSPSGASPNKLELGFTVEAK